MFSQSEKEKKPLNHDLIESQSSSGEHSLYWGDKKNSFGAGLTPLPLTFEYDHKRSLSLASSLSSSSTFSIPFNVECKECINNEVPKPKVILISGGTKGIGAALVSHYAEKMSEDKDIKIATFSSKENNVNKAKSSYQANDNIYIEQVDIRNKEGLETFVNQVIDRFGQINVLINNAAVAGPLKPILECTDTEEDETTDVNQKGAIRLTKLVLQKCPDVKVIINVTSAMAEAENITVSSSFYSMSKAALNVYTFALNAENAAKGKACYAFAFDPGAVDTGMLKKVKAVLTNLSIHANKPPTCPVLTALQMAFIIDRYHILSGYGKQKVLTHTFVQDFLNSSCKTKGLFYAFRDLDEARSQADDLHEGGDLVRNLGSTQELKPLQTRYNDSPPRFV